MKTRLLYLLPLSVFLVLAVYFAIGLTKDPNILPSALINKPVPEFSLPPIEGGPGKGFSSADLKGNGVSVVNVFASWCVPCRAEHAYITRLAEMKIAAVYGFNFKDRPEAALAWLDELGNPYAAIGADTEGQVAIDFGVYGIPETFVIDRGGRIRFKHVGAITPDLLKDQIVPLIRKLSK